MYICSDEVANNSLEACLHLSNSAWTHLTYEIKDNNNNNNLQAFQLIVLARYLLGVPIPSPVSHKGWKHHTL